LAEFSDSASQFCYSCVVLFIGEVHRCTRYPC